VNLDEDPNGAAFRREVREWLSANAEVRPPGALRLFESDHDETTVARARHWQAKKFAAGWAGITWPREHGGRGGTVTEQVIWNQEVEAFDAPEDVFMVGIAMGGPTLIAHGTGAQQAALLPPLLRGEEIWCQLFSEPDAGSDLASLRTAARPVEGGFVVQGQKVWTTMGQHARRGLLLTRTNIGPPFTSSQSHHMKTCRLCGCGVALNSTGAEGHMEGDILKLMMAQVGLDLNEKELNFCCFCLSQLGGLVTLKREMDRLGERLVTMIIGLQVLFSKTAITTDPLDPSNEVEMASGLHDADIIDLDVKPDLTFRKILLDKGYTNIYFLLAFLVRCYGEVNVFYVWWS